MTFDCKHCYLHGSNSQIGFEKCAMKISQLFPALSPTWHLFETVFPSPSGINLSWNLLVVGVGCRYVSLFILCQNQFFVIFDYKETLSKFVQILYLTWKPPWLAESVKALSLFYDYLHRFVPTQDGKLLADVRGQQLFELREWGLRVKMKIF